MRLEATGNTKSSIVLMVPLSIIKLDSLLKAFINRVGLIIMRRSARSSNHRPFFLSYPLPSRPVGSLGNLMSKMRSYTVLSMRKSICDHHVVSNIPYFLRMFVSRMNISMFCNRRLENGLLASVHSYSQTIFHKVRSIHPPSSIVNSLTLSSYFTTSMILFSQALHPLFLIPS